jgi:hypothetical protein
MKRLFGTDGVFERPVTLSAVGVLIFAEFKAIPFSERHA